MDKRMGNRLTKPGRKTAKISIRCREEEKKKIEKKAAHMGISESKLMEEAIEAVLKRRSRYDKGKVRSLVEMQEAMNHMVRDIGDGQDEYRAMLMELMERSMGLWEF